MHHSFPLAGRARAAANLTFRRSSYINLEIVTALIETVISKPHGKKLYPKKAQYSSL